jgi:hypothetical protein
MNNINIIILILTLLSSCDPNSKEVFNTSQVKLNANINDTTEVILLGDTLVVSLQVPDTVVNTGSSVRVESLQKGEFYLGVYKYDTINKNARILLPPYVFTSKGSISNTNSASMILTNDSKPYEIKINFTPPSKGIYYLEVFSQAGNFDFNQNYKTRLFVNFSVTNRHNNLITPFLGQSWNDAVEQSNREGFGIYAFRVN